MKAGELPAPQIFLNATSAREGEWVSLQCMPPNITVTKFVFCKDGRPFSSHKPKRSNAEYILPLQITWHSVGQYSCGYQQKYGNNQEKNSALSVSLNLNILLGPVDQSGGLNSCTGQKTVTILSVVVAILILSPLVYLLIKKGLPRQRSSRGDIPVKNRSSAALEEEVQYAKIVGLHRNEGRCVETPSTQYVAIAPLHRKAGINAVAPSQTSNTSHEDN